tara:strand:- start:414 stop:899 length:486 start_codon:yes stop_codon:yes gene_type:complete
MATGTIFLPVVPQGLDASNPPGLEFISATGEWQALFDDGTDEVMYWAFRCPVNYASAPVIKVPYSASATSGTFGIEVAVMATSDGDSADVETASFDTVNAGSATVPGTAGYPDEISLALANDDSMAAGDRVVIKFIRNTGVGSDTAGDVKVASCALEYTTI